MFYDLPLRLLTIAQRFNAGPATRSAMSPGGTEEAQQYSNYAPTAAAFFRPSRDSARLLICNPALKRWAIIR
jgi:hypothetical protein